MERDNKDLSDKVVFDEQETLYPEYDDSEAEEDEEKFKQQRKAPRGRMTAYAFFVQDCRAEQIKNHPGENIIFEEFSQYCKNRWKAMSDIEKDRFHEMADEDQKRYDSEMQQFQIDFEEKTLCNSQGRESEWKAQEPKNP